MAGLAEGIPRYVEPPSPSQQLVGEGMSLQEVNEVLELGWVLGANVGSLTEQMLRILDATNKRVDTRIAEAGIDDDGADLFSGWLQEHQATIGHVGHMLERWFIIGIFADVEEFFQRKVRR